MIAAEEETTGFFPRPSRCPAGGMIFTSCNLYLLRLVRRPSGQHKNNLALIHLSVAAYVTCFFGSPR